MMKKYALVLAVTAVSAAAGFAQEANPESAAARAGTAFQALAEGKAAQALQDAPQPEAVAGKAVDSEIPEDVRKVLEELKLDPAEDSPFKILEAFFNYKGAAKPSRQDLAGSADTGWHDGFVVNENGSYPQFLIVEKFENGGPIGGVNYWISRFSSPSDMPPEPKNWTQDHARYLARMVYHPTKAKPGDQGVVGLELVSWWSGTWIVEQDIEIRRLGSYLVLKKIQTTWRKDQDGQKDKNVPEEKKIIEYAYYPVQTVAGFNHKALQTARQLNWEKDRDEHYPSSSSQDSSSGAGSGDGLTEKERESEGALTRVGAYMGAVNARNNRVLDLVADILIQGLRNRAGRR